MRFILRRESLKHSPSAVGDDRPRTPLPGLLLRAILRDQSNVEDVMRLRRKALGRRD